MISLDDNSQLKNDRKNLQQEFLFPNRIGFFFKSVKQVLGFRKSNLKINLVYALFIFVILTYFQSRTVGDLKKFFLTVLAKLQLRPIKIELFGLVRRDLRLSEERSLSSSAGKMGVFVFQNLW